jgi:KaiC/GvpD/RAD55 family RecA-like ATPase/transcriptional regulator with XRE-family HTH domain
MVKMPSNRHHEAPNTFATAITKRLEDEHLSQKDLATRLNLHPATVSLWTSGEQTPREDDDTTVGGVAAFLGMTPQEVKELIRASKERIRSSQVHGHPPQTLDSLFQFLGTVPKVPNGRTATRLPLTIPLTADALTVTYPFEPNQEARFREFVQTSCRVLEEQFARSVKRELRDDEFTATIKHILNAENSDTQTSMATTLRSALLGLKVVEECQVGNLLQQRYPISESYVVNSLFGLRTNIRNLDWLLDGGLILPTGGTGLTALVKGKPGTGKTMLALQVAASFAAAGHLVTYVTVEKETDLLLGKLKFAGYRESRENEVSIMTRNQWRFALVQDVMDIPSRDELTKLLRAGDHAFGLMVITSIPGVKALNRMRREFRAILERTGADSQQRRFYTCFFIDSIDALLNSHHRKIYRELFDFTSKKSHFGLFISETSDERPDLTLRDYVVDMSFRLGYRIEAEGVKSRVLEIEKCRGQSVRLGEHLFEIGHGYGIAVKPSISSLLSVWSRRIRRYSQFEEESWSLATGEQGKELDLSACLAGDVVTGSAILLSGPPATHKLALGLSFLAAGIAHEKGSQDSQALRKGCLLVSLREDQRSLERIIHTYDQLSPLLAGERDSSSINPCLEILYDPPTYLTPEGFMDWIREALANLSARGKRISRVLINSLTQLRLNSPICEREPLLIPSLIELFKKESITSLFINVGQDRRSEIQQIFDTIIFTERNDDPSELDENRPHRRTEDVRLIVGHSIPGNADRATYQLERVQLERVTNGPVARLKLTRDYYAKPQAERIKAVTNLTGA